MENIKDIEKEMEKIPEEIIEDLSSVDMSIPSKAELEIMVDERLMNIVTFHRFQSRLEISKLSAKANLGVGNKEQAQKHQNEQKELETGLAYCKRAVKFIDSRFPKAKEIMQRKAGG